MLASEIGHPLGLKAPPDASVAMRLPWLRLGCAMLYRAIQDLRDERDAVALDALLWLCLAEPPRWVLDLLQFEASTPAELIGRGLPEIGTRPTGRKLGRKYKHLKGGKQ